MNKILKLPLYYFTYFLSTFIIPKKKNLWIFKGFADKYIDNSKYLFEYINNNDNNDIKAIWITDEKETYLKVKQNGFQVHNRLSFYGLYYSLSAEIVFYGDYTDIWTTNGSLWVNLWHGTPLKKIEHDIKKGALKKIYSGDFLQKLLRPHLYRKPDYIISSSKYISKNTFSTAFRIPEERCLNFGYPRNDYINIKDEKKLDNEILRICKRYKQIFLYLPTWRDGNFNFIIEANIDLDKLNTKLISINSIILFKSHPASKLSFDKNSYSNIYILDNNIDLYSLIPFTDVLITDYSSIYFDYLLTGKPIIYFSFDYKDYINSRDLYFNYSEFISDKPIYDFSKFLEQIDIINKNNKNTLKYKDLKRKIWEFDDNLSSKRIVNYLLKDNNA